MGLTYANEAAGIEVLKTPNHTIRVPAPTHLNEPSKDPFEEQPPSEFLTSPHPPLSSKNAEEEIIVRVNICRMDLQHLIKLRTSNILRTNRTVQSRINKRMLRGFEGFHGELTRLWDNVEDVSREETIKKAAEDKLRNDRRGKSSYEPRRYKAIREFESRQEKEDVGKELIAEESKSVMGGPFLNAPVLALRAAELEKLSQKMEMSEKVISGLRQRVWNWPKRREMAQVSGRQILQYEEFTSRIEEALESAEEDVTGSTISTPAGDAANEDSREIDPHFDTVGDRMVSSMDDTTTSMQNGSHDTPSSTVAHVVSIDIPSMSVITDNPTMDATMDLSESASSSNPEIATPESVIEDPLPGTTQVSSTEIPTTSSSGDVLPAKKIPVAGTGEGSPVNDSKVIELTEKIE